MASGLPTKHSHLAQHASRTCLLQATELRRYRGACEPGMAHALVCHVVRHKAVPIHGGNPGPIRQPVGIQVVLPHSIPGRLALPPGGGKPQGHLPLLIVRRIERGDVERAHLRCIERVVTWNARTCVTLSIW